MTTLKFLRTDPGDAEREEYLLPVPRRSTV